MFEPSSDDEVEEAVRKLRALDLKVVTIDEIKEMLFPVFKGFHLNSPIIPPGHRLYRGRVISARPTHLSELSYPQPEQIKFDQRVNRARQSMFYCTNSRRVPFFELGVGEGQHIVISHWLTAGELRLNNAGYSDTTFRNLASGRDTPRCGAGHGGDSRPLMQEAINKLVAEFLSAEFTRQVPPGEEHLYKITIAIAEKHLNSEMFDGLIYPSIPMKANADNLALWPGSADTHLSFVKAEYTQVESKQEFNYEARVLDTVDRVDSKGRLLWKGRGDRWVIKENYGQLMFTEDDGRWVARDEQGNVVEPE